METKHLKISISILILAFFSCQNNGETDKIIFKGIYRYNNPKFKKDTMLILKQQICIDSILSIIKKSPQLKRIVPIDSIDEMNIWYDVEFLSKEKESFKFTVKRQKDSGSYFHYNRKYYDGHLIDSYITDTLRKQYGR
jgi:hypothetical protein